MSKNDELVVATDKLFNASIVEGVLKDAQWALEAKRQRAAAILTYCGVDTMASLMRDAKSPKVQRSDFVGWVERHMDFRTKEGPSGLELYGARCGLLHSNMAESDHSKAGTIRMIGYVDDNKEPVLRDEKVKDLILLSTRHLVGIFAEGVLKSWREIKADTKLLALVHERLQKLFTKYDVKVLKA